MRESSTEHPIQEKNVVENLLFKARHAKIHLEYQTPNMQKRNKYFAIQSMGCERAAALAAWRVNELHCN